MNIELIESKINFIKDICRAYQLLSERGASQRILDPLIIEMNIQLAIITAETTIKFES
jgi:hypothetical protein